MPPSTALTGRFSPTGELYSKHVPSKFHLLVFTLTAG